VAEAQLALADDPKRLKQADATVHEALRRTEASGVRVYMVEALRVQGMLQRRNNDVVESRESFEKAISLAHSMPYPYCEARTLLEYGMRHGSRGQIKEARERLVAALAIFQQLGAWTHINRTQRAVQALERRYP
jgi:tetratricopeptide (TPR) repeat protein